MTFKDKCEQLQISYSYAIKCRRAHLELTDEQIIEYYLTKEKETFKDRCDKAKIDYANASSYRQKHPELTDEQVIIHYRPDCYINLLGELIIPEGE